MKFINRIRIPAVIIAAIFSLSSCASSETMKRMAHVEQISSWAPKARELVEQHRGVNLSGVGISTAAGRGMLHVVQEINRRQTDSNTPWYLSEKAFQSMAFSAMYSALAIYDPYRKNIVINQPVFQRFLDSMHKEGISRRDAAMTVLIHEMVHAADDVEYDLVALRQQHRGDKLGVHMVTEGHAELLTEYLCVKAGCLEAFYTAHKLYARDLLDHNRSQAPIFNGSSAFVYMQGLRFLKSLERRDPTGALVKQALKNPPGDALEFFDVEGFPDRIRSDRRAYLYNILETVKLTMPGKVTSVPETLFDLSALPNDRNRRDYYISRQREQVLASASMNYYYQLDQRSFTSVKVDLYETASAEVAKELASQLMDHNRQNHLTNNSPYIKTSTLNKPQLQELSNGLPDETQRIIRDISRTGTSDSTRYFTSLFSEGPYLIRVDNSNNNELNKHVLIEMLEALREQSNGQSGLRQ